MPKKNKAKTIQLSQKNRITKRLMAISLKVDKYIYKNKPISMLQAQSYLQEVKTYKAPCLRDERSLQVIEKLTRCMKAIIEELKSKELTTESESLYDGNQHVGSYMASPVYSLTEEDKTLMMEYMNDELNEDANYKVNKEENTPHTSNTVDDNKITESCDNLIETCISQTHNEPVTSNAISSNTIQNHTERNVDVEIIDLTLNDNEIPSSNVLCSQSILNNIEKLENVDNTHSFIDGDDTNTCSQDIIQINKEIDIIMQHDETPTSFTNQNFTNNTCGQDMSEVDKEINKIMNTKEIAANTINKSNTVLPKALTNVNNLETTENTMVNECTENFKIQEVFDEISKSRKPANKPQKVINKTKHPNKKKTRKEDDKENKNIKTKTPTLKKTKNIILKNTKKYVKPIIPVTDFEETRVSNDTSLNTSKIHSQSNDDVPKAFLKTIVEDLSWVENIRYVRQINSEEYDPKLNSITDAFWENCLLPENWDVGDFEY